ncbi:restriction endonuclease subunit S [Paenibacillus larvae]
MDEVKLGGLVHIDSGYAFKSSYFNEKEGLPIIRIRDVTSGSISTYYSGEYDEKYLVENNDILISMDGTFSVRKWSTGKALLNQRVCRIKSLNEKILLDDYLYYILPKYLKKIEDKTSFVTVKHLSVKDINEIFLLLPNIEAQRKTVLILDKAQELINKRKKQIEACDKLIKGLFYDMFGDPVLNNKFTLESLGSVSLKITDGTHHSPENTKNGVPYITAKHLGSGSLDFYNAPMFISLEDHKKIFARCNPEKGDVLYIKDGATTGIACINHYDFEFSMLSSLELIKTDITKLSSIYLVSYLNNDQVKKKVLQDMAGGAIKRLTLKKINAIPILLPPIHLQNRFAEQVEKIEQQKLRLQQSLTELENNFKALMQRAFKGELF